MDVCTRKAPSSALQSEWCQVDSNTIPPPSPRALRQGIPYQEIISQEIPMDSSAEASPQPNNEQALRLHAKHPVSFWGSLQCNSTGCHIVKHIKEQITNNEERRH